MSIFYRLRDNIIPHQNIEEFDKILSFHENSLSNDDYNELLGAALYHYNLYIITSLNLFIRQFNIKTTKYGILLRT